MGGRGEVATIVDEDGMGGERCWGEMRLEGVGGRGEARVERIHAVVRVGAGGEVGDCVCYFWVELDSRDDV